MRGRARREPWRSPVARPRRFPRPAQDCPAPNLSPPPRHAATPDPGTLDRRRSLRHRSTALHSTLPRSKPQRITQSLVT